MTEKLPDLQKQFLRQAEAEVSWDSHDWYITVFLSIVYFPTSFFDCPLSKIFGVAFLDRTSTLAKSRHPRGFAFYTFH